MDLGSKESLVKIRILSDPDGCEAETTSQQDSQHLVETCTETPTKSDHESNGSWFVISEEHYFVSDHTTIARPCLKRPLVSTVLYSEEWWVWVPPPAKKAPKTSRWDGLDVTPCNIFPWRFWFNWLWILHLWTMVRHFERFWKCSCHFCLAWRQTLQRNCMWSLWQHARGAKFRVLLKLQVIYIYIASIPRIARIASISYSWQDSTLLPKATRQSPALPRNADGSHSWKVVRGDLRPCRGALCLPAAERNDMGMAGETHAPVSGTGTVVAKGVVTVI